MQQISTEGRPAIFHGPVAGVVISLIAGLFFISLGIWFYRWGKQIRRMSFEERSTHPRAQGTLGISAVGYSLKHPWVAFAQAYVGIGVGVLLLALSILVAVKNL
jgi:hypothetical protein